MEIIIYTLKSLSSILFEPSLLFMLCILSLLFYMKNKKIVAMQRMIIGEEIDNALELTLSQLVFGILFGIIGSLLLTSLGITFKEMSGIQFIFVLSVILMFLRPRFVCFSYSGAVLGLLSIIVTVVSKYVHNNSNFLDIDIMCLMTFVGVMHIVEGILVMIDGSKGAIPVFSKKDDKIIGGYALSRYWIVPISLFLALKGSSISGSINTPDWWPLLRSEYITTILATAVIVAMPFFGILGYSSVSFTRKKRSKAISSGLFILAYGVTLSFVAQLARGGIIWQVAVLVFAPVAHEIMLRVQINLEERREPMFISDDTGITILDVVPYSEIYDLGVRPQDKIIRVNGEDITSDRQIYETLKVNRGSAKFQVLNISGNIREVYLTGVSEAGFGAILVPKVVSTDKVVPIDGDDFSKILHKVDKDDKTK